MSRDNVSGIEYMERLTHLIVLLDSSAPSICYYDVVDGIDSTLMPYEVLEQVVEYAKVHNIFLNFVYGFHEFSDKVNSLIESIPHVKIIPYERMHEIPEGIPVMQYTGEGKGSFVLPFEDITNLIVRVAKNKLNEFIDEAPLFTGRVKRINILLDKLNTYSEQEAKDYQQQLKKMAEIIQQTCISGAPLEFSSITDRMMLDTMRNCDAGITNFTVAPDGAWYLCPGFYYTGKNSLGNLDNGILVKNQKLLNLEYAPICNECDCYHCKRCVYLNQLMTMELNTPSHIQCVISHKEREVSRILIRNLQKEGMLQHLPEITKLNYEDPLDLITGKVPIFTGEDDSEKEEILEEEILEEEFFEEQIREEQIREEQIREEQIREEQILEEKILVEQFLEEQFLKEQILEEQFLEEQVLEETFEEEDVDKENAEEEEKSCHCNHSDTGNMRLIGKVTYQESDEIKKLYQRKSSLEELIQSFVNYSKEELDASGLYERMITDYTTVRTDYQTWWDRKASLYRWSKGLSDKYQINFDTCEIFSIGHS